MGSTPDSSHDTGRLYLLLPALKIQEPMNLNKGALLFASMYPFGGSGILMVGTTAAWTVAVTHILNRGVKHESARIETTSAKMSATVADQDKSHTDTPKM